MERDEAALRNRAFPLTEYDVKKRKIDGESSPKIQINSAHSDSDVSLENKKSSKCIRDLLLFRISNPTAFSQRAFDSELLALPWQAKTARPLATRQSKRDIGKSATFGALKTEQHVRKRNESASLFPIHAKKSREKEEEESVGEKFKIAL